MGPAPFSLVGGGGAATATATGWLKRVSSTEEIQQPLWSLRIRFPSILKAIASRPPPPTPPQLPIIIIIMAREQRRVL